MGFGTPKLGEFPNFSQNRGSRKGHIVPIKVEFGVEEHTEDANVCSNLMIFLLISDPALFHL